LNFVRCEFEKFRLPAAAVGKLKMKSCLGPLIVIGRELMDEF
jgi:hypothetical protein